jgi:hypothetical protein
MPPLTGELVISSPFDGSLGCLGLQPFLLTMYTALVLAIIPGLSARPGYFIFWKFLSFARKLASLVAEARLQAEMPFGTHRAKPLATAISAAGQRPSVPARRWAPQPPTLPKT